MKAADDCTSMAEIRADVEALDREIIRLLGRRLQYVRSAVRFKPDERSIRHPDHWERFFALRRDWAAEEGYDPGVIDDIYRRLYEYTVEVQLGIHRRQEGR